MILLAPCGTHNWSVNLGGNPLTQEDIQCNLVWVQQVGDEMAPDHIPVTILQYQAHIGKTIGQDT